MTTKIEWVLNPDGTKGQTWNPITGCSKISLGCKNCYAERLAKRLAGRVGYPKKNPFQVTGHPQRLNRPLEWKKGVMVFVCSMSDIFHEKISDDFILRVFQVIRKCPQHTFQVLTKRSGRLLTISEKIGKWPANVWLGVTVESSEYRHRIDQLRSIPVPIRFISCEPLLGNLGEIDLGGIDWVIVGGESGPGARTMSLEWVTNIRDQCIKNSVPFFFKQWGGVNKKLTGRKLQGVEWNQMPSVPRF
jgi:protein gp37